MTRQEFVAKVREKFEGAEIRFHSNEAMFSATVDSVLVCMSSPYSDSIRMFWHGKFIGFLQGA